MSGTNSKHQILLLRPLFPFLDAALSPIYDFLRSWESPLPLPDFLSSHAARCRVILSSGPNPPAVSVEIISLLPELRLVVATSAGVNHIDLDACRRRGVRVANAGSVFSADVADYAVGMAIDVLRRISAADRYVRRGLWALKGGYPLGSKVGGKRIGIVGLGSIGSEVAKRLEAFGCIIMYNSRSQKPSVPYKYFSNVRDLAVESDVLVLSCSLTAETHHLINRDILLALGKNGVLINIGRGALVDEKELVRCLMEGVIGGAGLDVFENEPHVPKELFHMDNVVLSSHRAVITPESIDDLCEVVIGNLEAFFANRELLTPISL
ncbi:glyoxylate/hydroxypyruvate reductase HPR3-like [Typha angustifolia]|uniref:glyoxylate/hydroxypyruvate reductase HPR3-like n=1 Tax=Typha angustifolia TaxID=59011 RepID=UPI003C2E7CFD